MTEQKENKTGRTDTQLSEAALLERLIKTLELVKVDQGIMADLRQYIQQDTLHQAWFILKEYNAGEEKFKEIKITRPILHGYEENEIFSKLIQEGYVTAKLYNADDRLLNAMWSTDWQELNPESQKNA